MQDQKEVRKLALVTGGAVRVGAAIARKLHAEGYDLALHYRSSRLLAEAFADELLARRTNSVRLYTANLEEVSECRTLVQSVTRDFGRLDLVVLSAARFDRVHFEDATAENFDETVALNVRAPFFLAQEAAPHLRATKGNIVGITCSSTRLPYPNFLPYVVSKAAMQQLLRTLAIELAPDVRVNAVAPGSVLPPPSTSDTELDALRERTLTKTLGDAEDVADAVLYFSKAQFVTGQELLLDGGATLAGRYSGEA